MDEARRHQVYDVLRERLGEEAADLIMSHLPPVPWTDLLTKQDLDRALRVQSAELRAEIADLRGELRGEVANVRDDGARLRGEIAEVRGEIAEVRDEVAALRLVVARQAWIMTVGVITAVSAAVGVTATLG